MGAVASLSAKRCPADKLFDGPLNELGAAPLKATLLMCALPPFRGDRLPVNVGATMTIRAWAVLTISPTNYPSQSNTSGSARSAIKKSAADLSSFSTMILSDFAAAPQQRWAPVTA